MFSYAIIGCIAALATSVRSQGGDTVPSDLSAGFDGGSIELQTSYSGDSANGFQDGAKFTQQETSQVPEFALGDSSGVNTNLKFIIAMVDTTEESNRVLHYLRSDFKASGSKTGIESSGEPEVPYKAPGSLGETGERQYSFLLYRQRGTFSASDLPEDGAAFDVQSFQSSNSLDDPLAGNVMSVDAEGGDSTGGSEAPSSQQSPSQAQPTANGPSPTSSSSTGQDEPKNGSNESEDSSSEDSSSSGQQPAPQPPSEPSSQVVSVPNSGPTAAPSGQAPVLPTAVSVQSSVTKTNSSGYWSSGTGSSAVSVPVSTGSGTPSSNDDSNESHTPSTSTSLTVVTASNAAGAGASGGADASSSATPSADAIAASSKASHTENVWVWQLALAAVGVTASWAMI